MTHRHWEILSLAFFLIGGALLAQNLVSNGLALRAAVPVAGTTTLAALGATHLATRRKR